MESKQQQPDYMRIDLDAVLCDRLPKHYRHIPKWLIRRLEKVICQDQLNEMLLVNRGRRGASFCRGVLDHLHITMNYRGTQWLEPSNTRVVIASNHPLGGLDGMALIDFVNRHYGVEPLFVVNDLLMAIEPLRDVFVPVNKHGRQSRQALNSLDAAMASDRPVIIFPAGLVSRRQRGGEIADLKWQRTFVNKCVEYHRDVIPTYFGGKNSAFFYNFARLREKAGLKLNIEMVRLPREVFRAAGSTFDVVFGEPIHWENLRGGSEAEATARAIRETVYNLSKQ